MYNNLGAAVQPISILYRLHLRTVSYGPFHFLNFAGYLQVLKDERIGGKGFKNQLVMLYN